jgi:hypothetical protein
VPRSTSIKIRANLCSLPAVVTRMLVDHQCTLQTAIKKSPSLLTLLRTFIFSSFVSVSGDMGNSEFNNQGNLGLDCSAGDIDAILHMGDRKFQTSASFRTFLHLARSPAVIAPLLSQFPPISRASPSLRASPPPSTYSTSTLLHLTERGTWRVTSASDPLI